MKHNELLFSISNLMDKKLKPLESHMDSIERKLDVSVEHLDSSIHKINLKLENLIEPRLSEIENYYLTTYERYKIGNEKFEKIETDISILQSVVMEHHENKT